AKLIGWAIEDPRSALAGMRRDDALIDNGAIVVRSDPARRETLAALAGRHGDALVAQAQAKPGPEEEHYASRSFGAVFAEVRVDLALGVIRVPRIVAAYSVGRLLNAKMARSQLQGGSVWGVCQALFEGSMRERRLGRW